MLHMDSKLNHVLREELKTIELVIESDPYVFVLISKVNVSYIFER